MEADAMAMSASHLPLIGIQLRTRGSMRLGIVLVKMDVMNVKSLGSGRSGFGQCCDVGFGGERDGLANAATDNNQLLADDMRGRCHDAQRNA